jgi:UDP-N-acetyl-D-mannosaminuronic acid dehydrogenase
MVCDKEGINVWDLIELANKHPRVNILQPGPGVGGHCIAVDPWFIVSQNLKEAKIIRTAREINNYKTQWVIERINARIANFTEAHERKPRVVCLGLAFKPDIDDLRESPAILVAEALQNETCELVVVEPNIVEHDQFTLCSIQEALLDVDLVVLLVKHRQFLDEAVVSRLKLLDVEDFCGITQI